MTYRLTIPGKLPGMNEYTTACKRNPYAGADMKKKSEQLVLLLAKSQLRGVKVKPPVYLRYHWTEPNTRRDKDNIAGFGMKVIQDAIVRAGILPDDGWNYIKGFSHEFSVDKGNPRITVDIIET